MIVKILIITLILFTFPVPRAVWSDKKERDSFTESPILIAQKQAPKSSTALSAKERQLLLDEIKRLKKHLHEAELDAWQAKKELEEYKSWVDLEMHRKKLKSGTSQPVDKSPESIPVLAKHKTGESAIKIKEPILKHNSFYIDILGLSHLYTEIDSTFNIHYEKLLSDHLSIFFGLVTSYSSLNENFYEISVSKFGFKSGVKYYPFLNSMAQTGFWFGTNIEILFANQEYKDNLGTIETSDTQYLFRPEIGYKWMLGKPYGFFLSPFFGYYYSSFIFASQPYYSNLNISHSFFYTGLNVGIVF